MRTFVSLRPGSRFGPIYRTQRRRRVGGVIVFSAPSMADTPEVGVVAGKRVGGAVQRNRAKRRLREAAAMVDLQPQTAYVLVATSDVLSARFDEITSWLTQALSPRVPGAGCRA